jgi:hypothetical protein
MKPALGTTDVWLVDVSDEVVTAQVCVAGCIGLSRESAVAIPEEKPKEEIPEIKEVIVK